MLVSIHVQNVEIGYLAHALFSYFMLCPLLFASPFLYLALSRSFSHFGICERVCVRVYFLSFSGTYNEHPN